MLQINSGGHFQSMKIVDIAIYAVDNNLHKISCSYLKNANMILINYLI